MTEFMTIKSEGSSSSSVGRPNLTRIPRDDSPREKRWLRTCFTPSSPNWSFHITPALTLQNDSNIQPNFFNFRARLNHTRCPWWRSTWRERLTNGGSGSGGRTEKRTGRLLGPLLKTRYEPASRRLNSKILMKPCLASVSLAHSVNTRKNSSAWAIAFTDGPRMPR